MRSATKTAGPVLLSLVTFAVQSPPMRVEADPIAGKALFEGRGKCVTCHSLETRDRRLGPGLNWIGMLRPPESLRSALVERHPSMPSLSAAEIDHLVAYLRTLRSIPPSKPRERTREIPTASENVPFFNRPEREAEERSDALVKALEIREGATIADIGAGTGYFTWRLASYAGPQGKVIAVDIQPRMLDLIAETVKQHGLVNVDYVLGRETDPRLPPGSLDMVFIAHSYHEFSQPEKVMEAIRRSLKPQGRLVVVEYAKERKLAPASPLHKMSFDEIRDEIEPLGFDLERILDFLPVQHGLIFTVR
jgi:precorrin-6B methylase 2/mono/diheme cytochrome c family protein